ncbi:MAG: hypothetical protein U1F39_08570 [Steroidobacteraceae bacterium]
MTKWLVEIAGWLAAGLILSAYALLSTGRLRAGSRWYQGLNLAGAAGFVINSGWNGAIPSAALNVVWMGLACYALWRPPR